MRIRILSIGKPKLPFFRDAIADYTSRLAAYGNVELEMLKQGTAEQESAALLTRSQGTFRVLLDERGEQISSREFAAHITRWEHSRHKSVSFLIGGANGHTPALRQQADWVWALGKITLQHELALVVLLEQLYRARSINAGSPYHRD